MSIANITALRDEHVKTFEGLRAGSIEPKVATEINNAFGKIINSVRVQLQYYEQREEKPNIPFAK